MPHAVMLDELEIEQIRRTLKFEWFPGSEEERIAIVRKLTPASPTITQDIRDAHVEAAQ